LFAELNQEWHPGPDAARGVGAGEAVVEWFTYVEPGASQQTQRVACRLFPEGCCDMVGMQFESAYPDLASVTYAMQEAAWVVLDSYAVRLGAGGS
jgi:hypothetical protein